MLGVICEGNILLKSVLTLASNGVLLMYSRSIFSSRGVLFLCCMRISWCCWARAKASSAKRANILRLLFIV